MDDVEALKLKLSLQGPINEQEDDYEGIINFLNGIKNENSSSGFTAGDDEEKRVH